MLEPTRGSNILDLILTNEDNLVRSLKVGEHLGKSDHHVIRFALSFKHEGRENSTVMSDFAKGNFNLLR